MTVILGVVLTAVGIGCAIMSRGLFIGAREFGDGGMWWGGLIFGLLAFLALAGAAVLFVKAYRSRKGKK